MANHKLKAHFRNFDTLGRRDTLASVLSVVVLGLGGLAVAPILGLRGPQALGIFNQAYALYILLSQLGVAGIQFSVLKHISYNAGDKELCHTITVSGVALVSILAAVVSCLGFALSGLIGSLLGSSQVEMAVRVVMPAIFVFSINKVLISLINGLSKTIANAFFRALRFILLPAILALLVFSSVEDVLLPLCFLITEMVLLIAMIIYIYSKLLRFRAVSNLWFWMKEHITFGVKGMLAALLIEINTRVDVLLLGFFSSDNIVGVYSFAAIFAEGFAQFPISLRWIVDPNFGELFSKNNFDGVSKYSRKVRRTYQPLLISTALVAILLYPIVPQILNYEFGSVAWSVFAILMLGVALSSGYRIVSGVIVQAGQPQYYSLLIIIVICANVLIGLLLIPQLGMIGAAVTTATSYLLEAWLLAIFAKRVLGISV